MCLVWAFFAPGVSALVINEIMYDLPGNDTGHEWMEIFNEENNAATIATGTAGWRFYDGSNHLLNTPVQGSNTIAAGGFVIISASTSAFLADHPGFSGTVMYSAFTLGNTSDTLRLIDESDVVVSEVAYASSSGANGNGRTLERAPDGSFHESAINGGTPGATNSAVVSATPTPSPTPSATATPLPMPSETPMSSPTPSPSSTATPSPSSTPSPTLAPFPTESPAASPLFLPKIHINEFLPNAKESDAQSEWIELWNEENFTADISGWTLDDTDGGSPPYIIPQGTTVAQRSYIVFTRPTTGIALNNDVDVVRLIAPDGRIVEAVSYEKPPQGASSNRTAQGAFVWSQKPTPGAANIITANESSENPKPSQSAPASVSVAGDNSPHASIETSSLPAINTFAAETGYAKSPHTIRASEKLANILNNEDAVGVATASRNLAANAASAIPEPYESFFSRYALMLTVLVACVGAAALIRWRKKQKLDGM